MITGHTSSAIPFRKEFDINVFNVDDHVGFLDAPTTIAAGSHERVAAKTIQNWEYTLPTVWTRDGTY